jgi:hypothetical protein
MIRKTNFRTSGNPINLIVGLVILFAILFGLFKLASFLYRILAAISPVLLIAAAVVNYRVIVAYGKRLGALIKQNNVLGIAAVVLSIVGFPILSAYFLYAAIASKNQQQQKSRRQNYDSDAGEWINYEEIESKHKKPLYRSSYDENDLVQ